MTKWLVTWLGVLAWWADARPTRYEIERARTDAATIVAYASLIAGETIPLKSETSTADPEPSDPTACHVPQRLVCAKCHQFGSRGP